MMMGLSGICMWSLLDGHCIQQKQNLFPSSLLRQAKLSPDQTQIICLGDCRQLHFVNIATFEVRFFGNDRLLSYHVERSFVYRLS
jgi:hypothetical protein